ncbi:nascent polypeptide-associated complex protein [Candidatus Woesearchaeota archaeon]|nr:nascent polypeptide-associated complex protein [Candidatus Woesearchaeota archaeon]MBW3018338.1 nascent polypeptide-associated complex protein [Candidatus Woesearchaeota archaeon]
MIPGMNQRKMQQMMKRMGMQQVDIPAELVIIRTADQEYFFDSPQVSKVNVMGQETFQIVGKPIIRPLEEEVEIPKEDIETVIEQTGVSKAEALEALKKTGGDLAQAILNLKKEKEE